MKIWVVSRECAGLAEAGGVKNVTHSLCEEFVKKGHSVTLFIPVYGCSIFDSVKKISSMKSLTTDILVGDKYEKIVYTKTVFKNLDIKVVFINHQSFLEKKAVYVYTAEEQNLNPELKAGEGHRDSLFLDTLFSKATVQYIHFVSEENSPDIVHCHDASTAVVPAYISFMKDEFYKNTQSVVTIHNAGPAYHHEYCDIYQAEYYTGLPYEFLRQCMNSNRVEPFLIAEKTAVLTTVSDYYAKDLLNPACNDCTDGLSEIFYRNKTKIEGITNGIDYSRYVPENHKVSLLPYDMDIFKDGFSSKIKNRKFFLDFIKKSNSGENKYKKYSKDVQCYGSLEDLSDDTVYLAYQGRLVHQKGIDLIVSGFKSALEKDKNLRLIIAGQGEINFENIIKDLTQELCGKILFIKGYNRALARLCVVSADFLLLPSRFEPCGLEDFIGQIYSSLPIGHATGGLNKILDGKTGFLYEKNDEYGLFEAIFKAVDIKRNNLSLLKEMAETALLYVRKNYSWEIVVEKYINFFYNLHKLD